MTPKSVQALAFDLDGTLVDSIQDLANAANAMRENLGLTALPQTTLESYVGDGMSTLVHRALTEDMNQEADADLWQKGFTAFAQHYFQHIADYTRPYDGVIDGLKLLKQQSFPLVVITNKSERFAIELLKKLDLLDYFSLVLGGDSLPEKKPLPTPLIHACEVLNIQANELIMIGDSKNDILAAKAAGAIAVGVNYGYANMVILGKNPETKPDLIISSITDLHDGGWLKQDIIND